MGEYVNVKWNIYLVYFVVIILILFNLKLIMDLF